MRRAVKIPLKFATGRKRRAIDVLLQEYRRVVNLYIQSVWDEPGRLDKDTLARVQNTSLSQRYKSQALRQALQTVVLTKKASKATGRPCSVPMFSGGAKLDAKFVSLEEGKGSFDLVLKLSTLRKGHRITVPLKRTKVLNKWLARGELVQGCELTTTHVILWVDVPMQEPKEGHTLALDMGVNKLLTTSDGQFLGAEFKAHRDRVKNSQSGTKAKRRAIEARNQYINEVLNKIPWDQLGTLVLEDLRGIKEGKNPKRGRSFRKAMAPWVHGFVRDRIIHKAEENRVRLHYVDPAYTSQTCPQCNTVSRNNRSNELFCCVGCGFTSDADLVGARNILARHLTGRSVESLPPRKVRL